jgi:hypothetical protein
MKSVHCGSFSEMACTGALLAQEVKTSHAIIVLPPGGHGRIEDAGLRRWLSRGQVSFAEPDSEMLIRVLGRIGADVPEEGLAGLRFWGQTGERSGAWMAAADPVHLETRLHSLRLRSLRPDELPRPELRVLFDHLQATLGTGAEFSFTRLGHYGYLHSTEALATAPVSAAVLHGLPPNEYVPSAESARTYHQLLGELQMALHEHDVNQARVAAGQAEINSLWLWGGGVAPEAEPVSLPLLIADDALFRGYWHRCGGDGADWGSDFDRASSNFVAVLPELSPGDTALAMTDTLHRVKRMLTRGKTRSVTLLFRDGLSIHIRARDALRLWRGESALLQKNNEND